MIDFFKELQSAKDLIAKKYEAMSERQIALCHGVGKSSHACS